MYILYIDAYFCTTRYALMPEVAFSVFACTEWEFRRSMSDFKPGEIIPVFSYPQVTCEHLQSVGISLRPSDIVSFGF